MYDAFDWESVPEPVPDYTGEFLVRVFLREERTDHWAQAFDAILTQDGPAADAGWRYVAATRSFVELMVTPGCEKALRSYLDPKVKEADALVEREWEAAQQMRKTFRNIAGFPP